MTSQNASVTLLEVSTLRFIARILSMSGGEPQRNSDITIEFILMIFYPVMQIKGNPLPCNLRPIISQYVFLRR